jgi:hypothetical protein
LINTLKAEVPIWKEQHFTSGDSEWVGLTGEDSAISAEPVPAQQAHFDQVRSQSGRP